MEPGEAIGVIGPSGSGKSSLVRALTGVWPCAGGAVRLGGAALDRYGADALGRYIGCLPQRVDLFDGTVAENIARLGTPDEEMVVWAAQRAGAHEMILALPQGYDTPITARGAPLTGGQMQRVGLARALYGNPLLLVLDEPDANLDAEGAEALRGAIRSVKAAGGAVVIAAHRPAAIGECEKVLVLDEGMRTAFGPREEVLRQVLRGPDVTPLARGAAS